MAEPVSRRQFAKLVGVSESAVRAAIKAKRISILPDGRLDPEAACAEWNANTDPARSRVSGKGAQRRAHVRTERDARQAIGMVARVLAEEGHPDAGGELDYGKVRTADLILKARQREIDQAIQSRRLVDRRTVETRVFELARNNRDQWLNWPSRTGILIANEVSIDRQSGQVDARSMTVVLDRFVRQHLEELAAPQDIDLGLAR